VSDLHDWAQWLIDHRLRWVLYVMAVFLWLCYTVSDLFVEFFPDAIAALLLVLRDLKRARRYKP